MRRFFWLMLIVLLMGGNAYSAKSSRKKAAESTVPESEKERCLEAVKSEVKRECLDHQDGEDGSLADILDLAHPEKVDAKILITDRTKFTRVTDGGAFCKYSFRATVFCQYPIKGQTELRETEATTVGLCCPDGNQPSLSARGGRGQVLSDRDKRKLQGKKLKLAKESRERASRSGQGLSAPEAR